MAATLGPPSIALLRPTSSLSSLSDSASLHTDHDHAAQPRFPHTRAQLAAIARLYKAWQLAQGVNESRISIWSAICEG